MRNVTSIALHETVLVDNELSLTAFYAGHVLGAAMFHVVCGDQSIVYTGDFNTTSDRHLSTSFIPRLAPNLLVTESTFATTTRDSKRCRERKFLLAVHQAVACGGKVLVPVSGAGRAQELLILLETYWERMGLMVPVYVTAGILEKSNMYYRLFAAWTSPRAQVCLRGYRQLLP